MTFFLTEDFSDELLRETFSDEFLTDNFAYELYEGGLPAKNFLTDFSTDNFDVFLVIEFFSYIM